MSKTAPLLSNSDEMAKGKRKQCDQDSVGSEYESACAKRPRIEEISFWSENRSFPTDVNEQWDLIQTVPSVIEVNGVTIYDLDSKVLCILRSGTEIITENVCVFNTQCSEKAECRPMDSHSFETPPITENSGMEYKHINNSKNNCNEKFLWLTNFKVCLLFRADEVEYNRNYKGQENEE
jgi:hypothetical protein